MRESRKRIPSNHSQTAATALGKAVMSEQDGKGSGNKGGHREEGQEEEDRMKEKDSP